jgi:next-to-BRCA1 protein 1
MCEQGFYDTEMNRRLMFKNKGSVKRVVKELVQMYKDPSISGKEQV